MRDVAVVSYAQTKYTAHEQARNEVEMLMPVLSEAVGKSGIPRKEIGFTCSGSTDYLAGPVHPPIEDVEPPDPARAVVESLMLGLRLRDGLPIWKPSST